jgi:hypothetical protein
MKKIAFALLLALPAMAGPIAYKFTGTSGGSIGPTVFGATSFSVTASGDTSDISGNFFYATHATIDITGVGMFTITDPLTVFTIADRVGWFTENDRM